MPRNVTLLTVCMLALVLFTGGCAMIEKPSAKITGERMQDVSLTNATMLLDVEVNNPYSAPLPLSDVDYALSSEGQKFLTGKTAAAGTIPANGAKTFSVPIKISYAELIQAVKGARPGATIPYQADVGLSVDAPVWGAIRLPMTRTGELKIPTGTDLLNRLKDMAK